MKEFINLFLICVLIYLNNLEATLVDLVPSGGQTAQQQPADKQAGLKPFLKAADFKL